MQNTEKGYRNAINKKTFSQDKHGNYGRDCQSQLSKLINRP